MPLNPIAPPASVVKWQDGHDYLTAVVRLKAKSVASDLGWYVVVREPVDIAFADSRKATLHILIAGLAAALIAAGLAWLAAGHLGNDLASLSKAALNVESGIPGATIPQLDSSTEMSALSTAVDRMTRRLITLNEQMEDKVKLRTQELEAANRELDRQSRSDHLTGVLNRRGFEAQLKLGLASARRRNSPMSVVIIDLDHFKQVNDRYGHVFGDTVLKAVAHAIRSCVKGRDLVARYGGEEFVVLLPATALPGALALAEQVRATICAARIRRAGATETIGAITVSLGVSVWRPGEPMEELVDRADRALYRSKSDGRNRVTGSAE
jgi:diguanylate cyclase (GGDEF)-like protein